MCQDFSNFSSFLHHFVLEKLATSSIRVGQILSTVIRIGTIARYGNKYRYRMGRSIVSKKLNINSIKDLEY